MFEVRCKLVLKIRGGGHSGPILGSLNNNFIGPKWSIMVQNCHKARNLCDKEAQIMLDLWREYFKDMGIFVFLSIYTDKYKNAHIFFNT